VMARSGRQSRSVEKRRFFMVCFDEVSCVLLFGINEGKRGT
jgi:hypothetical protein